MLQAHDGKCWNNVLVDYSEVGDLSKPASFEVISDFTAPGFLALHHASKHDEAILLRADAQEPAVWCCVDMDYVERLLADRLQTCVVKTIPAAPALHT